MTKQTGIVDRFEGDSVVVEVNGEMVNFDRADAPAMLCEGMVVIIIYEALNSSSTRIL